MPYLQTLPTGQKPLSPVLENSLIVGWLVILTGESKGKYIPLTYGEINLGSDIQNTFIIPDTYADIAPLVHLSISITKKNQLFELFASHDQYPVLVGNVPVQNTTFLFGGERICLGSMTLQFIALCGPDFSWDIDDIPDDPDDLLNTEWDKIDLEKTKNVTLSSEEVPIKFIDWDIAEQKTTGSLSPSEKNNILAFEPEWFFCTTDSILGTRNEQQDAVGCWHHSTWALFAIVDGAGGHSLGEVASSTAITTTFRYWKASAATPANDIKLWIESLFKQINQKISHSTYGGGRAAITVLLINKASSRYYVAHTGDTRFYHMRERDIIYRTKDDSIAQFLLEQKLITEEEFYTHPTRHQVTKMLGLSTDPEPHFHESLYSPGDLMFLCTDGVWNALRDDFIAASFADLAMPMYWQGPDCKTRQADHASSIVKSMLHSVSKHDEKKVDNAACLIISTCPMGK